MAEPIEVPFWFWARIGPTNHRMLDGGHSRSPYWRGQFWWIGAPIVNYRHFLPWAVQKQLNRSIYRLGCGLEWAEGCTNSIVFANVRSQELGYVAVTCWITLNRLRRRCAFCQITLTTCHLWTRPLTVAQIAKRFEWCTVLWAFHTIQPSSLIFVCSIVTLCTGPGGTEAYTGRLIILLQCFDTVGWLLWLLRMTYLHYVE